MTTSGTPVGSTQAGIATDVPGQPAGGKSEQAKEVAGAAADQGRQVAGTAAQQAKSVAADATEHARGLLDDALSQVDQEAHGQMDRLVRALQMLSDDLEHMADQSGTNGLASELTRQVANRTRDLGHQLDGREPRELLEDVRGFARRRPGTFLVGALVAGVVAGRFARGAKDASQNGAAGRSTRSTASETFPPDSLGAAAAGPAQGGFSTSVSQPIQPTPGGMR